MRRLSAETLSDPRSARETSDLDTPAFAATSWIVGLWVGSQVTVTAGDLVQLFEVHSGRGYQSHYGSRIQVGLGTRTQVDSVEIRWMGGSTQKLQNLWADRIIKFHLKSFSYPQRSHNSPKISKKEEASL